MRLNLKQASPSRIVIEKRGADGKLQAAESGRFDSSKAIAKAAKTLGMDSERLLSAVDAFRALPQRERQDGIDVDLTPPAVAFRLYVRGLHQTAGEASPIEGDTPLAALRLALGWPGVCPPEPLIHWDGTDRLAMVDVDFHRVEYAARPSVESLYLLAGNVRPRPRVVWSTHGRGLRLVYDAAEGFTAGELAAVAALTVATCEPSCRVELKTITRHPCYPNATGHSCGPVEWWTGDVELGAVRAWLGYREADTAQVAEWLASRGLEQGKRYPHERCPVRPEEHGGREPVCVREGGIYCHACAGRGVTRGSRTPGWFPYSGLCGTGIDTTLARCLAFLCHWEHARFVVSEATGLEGEVARLAYSAALRVLHGEDERVPAVFAAGRNVIRMDGYWSNLQGQPLTKDIRPILASLPAAAGSAERIARLDQPVDLTEEGYPPLQPVRGVRIYGHYLPLRNPLAIPIVMQATGLAHPSCQAVRPRYRDRDKWPVTLEDAWRFLEAMAPEINRDLVTLLIAARGCAEGQNGLPPMLFLCGPSGAAKTATVHFAAAICGDAASEVEWSRDEGRIRDAVRKAKEQGTFALFNEFLKQASKGGQSADLAMQFVLSLTPRSMSHKLYVGAVPLGELPVCVWTDTVIPDCVRQHAQIARRIVGAELHKVVEWEQPLQDHGIVDIGQARVQCPGFSDAADVILSDCIDRFFRSPTDFVHVAESLDFQRLSLSDVGREGLDTLREFFAAVCNAPPIDGTLASRYKGRGWKAIPQYGETDLSSLWRSLADEEGIGSRRCSEQDWAKLLGVTTGPVEFQCRAHGRQVAVRFAQHRTRTDYLVNEEIRGGVRPAQQPATEASTEGDWTWASEIPSGIGGS